MCGLVAVVSKYANGFQQKQVDIFTQMLYADEVRGADGTGIFYNPKQKEGLVRILKAPYKSSSFIRTKEYDEAMKVVFKESNFIVGHNRSATRGKLDSACTHPFREGHISLVHNGTLVSHKDLNDEYEVDSRAIAYSMEQIGAKETLKKIDGAFALIWFDAKDKTLNFCRNTQRPLHVLETASSFIITSEANMGIWIIERNGDKIIKDFVVEPKTLYSFDMDNLSILKTEPIEYLKYITPPVVYKSYPVGGASPSPVAAYGQKTSFAFGEKVKFKTGDIKGNYVEGDILKHQVLNINDGLVLGDFESQWRIKIYGTKEFLKGISNKKLCTGTVNHANSFNTKVIYHVGGVTEEVKTATILHLTSRVNVSDDLLDCEWCKEPFDKLKEVDGWHLCPSCEKSMYSNYGM